MYRPIPTVYKRRRSVKLECIAQTKYKALPEMKDKPTMKALSRIFKGKAPKIDWSSFLLEIVSVFIGITIAFALDNWKESRKNRETEIKTLIELKMGLNSDLIDALTDLKVFNSALKACNVYDQNFESTTANIDSLHYYSEDLLTGATFISNSSAYETLKTRGLETITNDSLRLQIAELYDVTYEHIYKWEELFLYPALFLNNFNYFRDNVFIYFKSEDGVYRHQYTFDTKTKIRTHYFLHDMKYANGIMVTSYADVVSKVKHLIHNLDMEIVRLQNE
ncbi:MAG: DUF6090 family protein [Cyclobacteriaceae bacterium]